MSNQWLRLWHDMPTDPKWRTIARASGQSIALVQAIYIHLLVDASRNVTRGHVTVTNEDIASALDVTEEQVDGVIAAMQGRVLDGKVITGWNGRQPKREDSGNDETGAKSAAQRKREQREREKIKAENEHEKDARTSCHEQSRSVTLDKEEDTDTEESEPRAASATPLAPQAESKSVRAITFDTFVARKKASSEKLIAEDDPIFEWAESAGIPDDWLRLAWVEFSARYKGNAKRYSDWPATFRNAVRNNWFKFWRVGEQGYVLTTEGEMARRAGAAQPRPVEAAA